jgi:hypothetical protein
MCTVSFVPKFQGFYLAMNRDENRERFAALAPTIVKLGNHRAIFPREPTGGTWISANDAGVCLALINWYRIKRKPKSAALSRGLVVKELAGESTGHEIVAAVKKLPIRRLRPFRLIAIVPRERRVLEWHWDLQRLAIRSHEWKRQHWFSSGFDEPRAEVERRQACDAATVEQSAISLMWLRQLHRSHAPKRGPFSICMHRPDAATVSYTEVAVSKQRLSMRYKSGSSCSSGAKVTKTISLACAS